MKKNIFILLVLSIIFSSCTNLDEIYKRLDDHERRIKSMETLVKNANDNISSIKTLLDAQQKKLSIVSFEELSDKSGYELLMSDGSKITLKNGQNGESPIINVKQDTDGIYYWTLNGEFITDGDGNKIKAEGQDGAIGITPKLRVNTDGYWEVSMDEGKTWTAVLGADGNPVKAVGSDATVDLTITEDENSITIVYDGKTFIIPKNTKPRISYKINIPNIDEFQESRILQVIDSNNNLIAEICLEYINAPNISEQLRIIYAVRDGIADLSYGVSLEDGATVIWDSKNNSCEYIEGSESNLQKIYISSKGEITTTAPSADLIETSLIPYVIEDIRGSESNTYGLTKIGIQYWMTENLRTLYYADGTAITTNLAKDDWLANSDGAVTFYDADKGNLPTMGALYNWYAVTNDKGLAPKGFRVSSDMDWALMAKYLDPENYDQDPSGARESETIAPLLKSTDGWNSNGNGNNLTGLNVFPYGSTSESNYMDYSGKGRQAYFWTSTNYKDNLGMFRRLYYDEIFTNRWYEHKTYGYSVRCIRE